VLAGGQGADHLVGMLVMSRGDDDQLKLRILQHGIEIARQNFDLIVPCEVAALRAGSADDAPEVIAIRPLAQLRHEHADAERAGADQRVVDAVGDGATMAA
jgi:hypothetical protein